MRKPNIPWTQEEKTALESMFAQGAHYSEIGDTLGRTHASVQRQLTAVRKRFLPHNPLTSSTQQASQ